MVIILYHSHGFVWTSKLDLWSHMVHAGHHWPNNEQVTVCQGIPGRRLAVQSTVLVSYPELQEAVAHGAERGHPLTMHHRSAVKNLWPLIAFQRPIIWLHINGLPPLHADPVSGTLFSAIISHTA